MQGEQADDLTPEHVWERAGVVLIDNVPRLNQVESGSTGRRRNALGGGIKLWGDPLTIFNDYGDAALRNELVGVEGIESRVGSIVSGAGTS